MIASLASADSQEAPPPIATRPAGEVVKAASASASAAESTGEPRPLVGAHTATSPALRSA